MKAGHHRPASETPFHGLGSSREHKCENSVNFRGRALGGSVPPVFPGFPGSGMHEDYASVCVC